MIHGIRSVLDVTLSGSDVATVPGEEKGEVDVAVYVNCSRCGGAGEFDGECNPCGGKGKRADGKPCHHCKGNGKKAFKCHVCGGSGKVLKP